MLFEKVVEQCRQAGIVPGEGFAVDGSFVHGDARRDRRVQTVDAIRAGDTSARPVREYLQALDAGNPAHEGGAKCLSPTDPAAAWNTKEGRGRFGYFTNYMIDTAHAVIVDVEATPARLAQEIKASKTMLGRIGERHGIKPERLAADKAYARGLSWPGYPSATLHRISRWWTANSRPAACSPAGLLPSIPSAMSLSVRRARY